MKREIQHILQIDIEKMNNCSITTLIAQFIYQNNIIDMVIDSYGKNIPNNNNTNNVAVTLKLPLTNKSPQKASPKCIEILKNFKIANINTLDEFL